MVRIEGVARGSPGYGRRLPAGHAKRSNRLFALEQSGHVKDVTSTAWRQAGEAGIAASHTLCGMPEAKTAQVAVDPRRIGDFCRRWRVTELALFGSVLREDFRPDSDVDVLVNFEAGAPWSLWDLSRMREELEEIFGRGVDLVEKKGLRNPFLRHAVLTTRQVVYAA